MRPSRVGVLGRVAVGESLPRKVVSRRKMGWLLHTFHWFMIVCTVGLWTPVYLSALRRRKTVTRYQ